MFTTQFNDAVIRIIPFNPLFEAIKFHYLNSQVVCPRTFQNPCPLCENYNHLWKVIESVKDLKTKHELSMEARKLKPIERYFYNVVALGEDRIKIFSVGRTLHEKIVKGICEAVPPKLGWFERLWRWLFRKPKKWSALDLGSGYDFVIKKNMHGQYPDYTNSGFVKISKPAGTKSQIEDWQKQEPIRFENIGTDKFKNYEQLLQMV